YIVGDFGNHRVDSYTLSGDPKVEGSAVIRFDSLDVPREDSLANEIAEFLACIINGRRPRVNGWDGCEALRVAKMVTDSMDEHRVRAEGILAGQAIGEAPAAEVPERWPMTCSACLPS